MDGWEYIIDSWQNSLNFSENSNLFSMIVFLIPGLISLKMYDFNIPNVRRDFSKSIFEVIAYSGMNFIFFYPLLSLISTPNFQNTHKYIFLFLMYFIFLIMPLMWPVIYLKILSLRVFSNHLPNPYDNPWDYVFAKDFGRIFVIVNFKNGERVGGIFGRNSFASSSLAKEQIYLEQQWILDDEGFVKPNERSKGIIIFRDEISSVELLK